MSTDKEEDVDLPLPKGWIKSRSKKFKKPYYYHEKTKCSIWVHPALLYPKEEETVNNTSETNHRKFTLSKKGVTFSAKPRSPETDQAGGEPCNFSSPTGRSLIPLTKKQTLKQLDKRASSLTGKAKTNVLDTQIENYGKNIVYNEGIKSDDKHKKGSLVDIDKKHWSKLIGYQSSSKKLKSLDKIKTSKNDSIRNHPYSNNELYSKSSDRTVDSASTRQKETKIMHSVKPKLKPLPPPNIKKGLKRISTEDVNSLTYKPELQKIKKGSGKEKVRDSCETQEKILFKDFIHKDSSSTSNKFDFKNTMTPAMKTVLARRGLITPNDQINEVKKSHTFPLDYGKETSQSVEKITDSKEESKPNAAMIAIRKKIEQRKQMEKLAEENEASTSCANNLKENTNQTKDNERSLVSKIFDTCVSLRKKLKPMRPSAKLKTQESSPQIRQRPIEQPKHLSNSLSQPDASTNLDIVEDMDVDEFEVTEGIRNFREDVTFDTPAADTLGSLPIYSNPLFVVVDTNVLLSNLNFVIELKDFPIHNVGPPVLMIPWIVFQELDSLKDSVKRYHYQKSKDGSETNRDLSNLARKAINSIGKCLDREHPRLKGQSIIEASMKIEGFKVTNNDDRIIHCALGLKGRAPKSTVVILSNDRNLCNKALVVGIKAFSHSNIFDYFKKFPSSMNSDNVNQMNLNIPDRIAIVSSPINSPSTTPPNLSTNSTTPYTSVETEKARANYLYCEVQHALSDIFTKIIETEMIEAYDKDLWLSIVKIKPPWLLEDTLTLFEKHWIAVFGNIVDRDLKGTILKLKDVYLELKSSHSNITLVKRMLQIGLEILFNFQKHSKYDGILPNTINKLQSYLDELNGKKTEPKKLNQHTGKKILLRKTPEASSDTGASSQCSSQQFSSYERVRLTLDQIWNTSTHFSGLVFASLKFPSPLVEQVIGDESIPTPEESMICLSVMVPCILSLVKSIHDLLTNSETTEPQSLVMNLLNSIYAFAKEVMKQECTLLPDDLLLFCQDSSNKDIFVQGFSQLNQLYGTLKQCEESVGG